MVALSSPSSSRLHWASSSLRARVSSNKIFKHRQTGLLLVEVKISALNISCLPTTVSVAVRTGDNGISYPAVMNKLYKKLVRNVSAKDIFYSPITCKVRVAAGAGVGGTQFSPLTMSLLTTSVPSHPLLCRVPLSISCRNINNDVTFELAMSWRH